MGQVTQEAFCINGHRLDEPPNPPPMEDRKPCPECGSLHRKPHLDITATADTYAWLGLIGKPSGAGRALAFMEQKVGASWSVARQKWMQVQQVVDRRTNRYTKKVVDPDTGEVLRDVDEPLTDHRGYGSAKDKRS